MAMYPRIPLISIIRNDLYISEDTFLDAFYFPDDTTRDEFINYFLLEYGEFTPIYQYPEYLLNYIKAVSASLKYSIDKLFATLSLEYNPIENYDRMENWTDAGENGRSSSGTENENTTYAGGETTTYAGGETTTYAGGQSSVKSGGHTETRPQHSTERQVSADNTGAYYPSEKTIEDQDSHQTVFNSETDTQSFNNRSDTQQFNNRTDTRQYNSRSDTRAGSNSNTEEGSSLSEHTGRIHGNIGVMTSMQMIKSEREDVSYYNFIDDVARLYGEKLCILIY